MDWYKGKTREPLIEGESITLVGQEFVIPRFRLWQHRDSSDARQVCIREKWADSSIVWAAKLTIMAVAMKANYPEMTEELIADNLDIDEYDALFSAVGRAFIRNPKPGEAQAPEKPGQNLPPTTGTDLSPASAEVSVSNGSASNG